MTSREFELNDGLPVRSYPHIVDILLGTNTLERWYFNGELHRIDGPAVISTNGVKSYYQEGELLDIDFSALDEDKKEYMRVDFARFAADTLLLIGIAGYIIALIF